jgi:hypothetical protein
VNDQLHAPTVLSPVSIAWKAEWVSELVSNVVAKSKYMCQPEIERRPLTPLISDCAVPAYFVKLLVGKMMDSVIEGNVIFRLHFLCGAQCELIKRSSWDSRLTANLGGRGWGAEWVALCRGRKAPAFLARLFHSAQHAERFFSKSLLYWIVLWPTWKAWPSFSSCKWRIYVFTCSPTTFKNMSYKLELKIRLLTKEPIFI